MGNTDLSDLKIKRESILPDINKSGNNTKKRGRPPKNDGELESESITIKITPSEFEALQEKAGDLIPISTLIKHYLRTKTDLFSKSKSNE